MLPLPDWAAYACGYVFSIGVGHVAIKPLVARMKEGRGEKEDLAPSQKRAKARTIATVGHIERAMYTTSWLFGLPGFIAVWLGLKVAGGLKKWDEQRTSFNVFLAGNALAIAFGVVGGVSAQWLAADGWVPAALAAGGLLAGTLALHLWWAQAA